MENKFKKGISRSEIIKIRIPDEAVQDWIETLMTEGFSSEEIDQILSNLNDKYREVKLSKEKKIINEALNHIYNYILKKYNIFFIINEEERKNFEKGCFDIINNIKKGYKEDFNEEISLDLLKKILFLILEQNIDKKFETLNKKPKE
ncbi:MAG: hypothetical protein N2Z85_00225 [Patescibacteria group bacterium]|nr:hypothetical protein [Patescibacteria group bacterium]